VGREAKAQRNKMISKEFERKLLAEGIDPQKVVSFNSKYSNPIDSIFTVVNLDDDTSRFFMERW